MPRKIGSVTEPPFVDKLLQLMSVEASLREVVDNSHTGDWCSARWDLQREWLLTRVVALGHQTI